MITYNSSIFKGIDKIVSNDQLRPVMNHAYINEGYIVATNAHILIKIDLNFFGLSKEDIILLEGKCLDKETLTRLGSMKSNQYWEITEQGFCLFNSNHKPSVIYPIEKMESIGTYPRYEQVIPETVQGVDYTCINAKLLVLLQAVYQAVNPGEFLKMQFHGEMKPMTLTSKCGQFTGLIMPVQCSF